MLDDKITCRIFERTDKTIWLGCQSLELKIARQQHSLKEIGETGIITDKERMQINAFMSLLHDVAHCYNYNTTTKVRSMISPIIGEVIRAMTRFNELDLIMIGMGK